MKGVELYARVRFAVQIEGVSRREAARRFGIDPRTVAKMLAFSVPPGYRRSRPPARPKLGPFTGIIDAILAADEGRPKKQRHTSKRIFERLRDEHGYSGGITIVKDYVLARRLRHREVFVPLRHDPGTRLQRYCEPLRHPSAPGLSLTGVRLIIPDHASGFPVLRALSLCTCCRHYPGAAAGCVPRSSHPAVSALPETTTGSACTSAFSRIARRLLTLRPAHCRVAAQAAPLREPRAT